MIVIFLFYGLLLFGLFFCFSDSLWLLLRRGNFKMRSLRRIPAGLPFTMQRSMTQRLRQTLISLGVSRDKATGGIVLFYFLTAVFFCVGFVWFSYRVSLSFGLLMGLFAASLPAGVLYVRLQKLRIHSSYEGDVLIHEFTNQYKIQHRNIIEALEQTAVNIPEAPLTAAGVIRLCHRLREVRSDQEIDEAFDEFVYQIDTSWAKKFALSLSAGLKARVVLDESLIDLADELAKARKILEQNKRVNNESDVIITYFTVPLYLGCMCFGSSYMGSSPKEAFHNQFMTTSGMKYFAFMLMSYAISIVIMTLFHNQKMDLD